MHYHRNPPKKSFFAYIIPFLILIILGLIVFLLIRFWGNLDERLNSETSYAYMQTVKGDAKVMLWGTTDWTSVPQSRIKLFKGDSIRALPGSVVRISLFDKHYLTLNGDSEVVINELRKEKQTLHTALRLNQGEAWLNVARDINPNSTFLVSTDAFQVKVAGAVLDLEPHVIRVLKGSTEATIYSEGEKIQEMEVGVGQELLLTDAKIKSLVEKDEGVDFITMLSDEFKLSGWYLFNAEGKNIGNTNTGEIIAEELDLIESTDVTSTETIADDTSEDAENIATEDELDFVLTKPIITSPAEDGEEYKITASSQRIEGKVKRGTTKVMVDNYELQSFKVGDTAWKYNADVKYNNLAKGRNEYKIYAVDAKGNKSNPAVITLIYEPTSVTEKPEETEVVPDVSTETEENTNEEPETETTETTTEVTGKLKITAPNDGKNLTTTQTHFVISGTAPSNASKIVVSGYTLTTFKLGDTTWKYTADSKYNNITVGETNTYKVIAYDQAGKVLATDTLVITVEETETSAEED